MDGPHVPDRWIGALVASTLLVAGTTMPGFLVAALAPSISQSFEFGPAEIGLAIALFNGVGALVSTRGGRWTDEFGAVAMLTGGVGLAAAASLALGALAGSAVAVTVALAVVGVGRAAATPVAGLLASSHVAPGRRGVTIGAQQAGAPLGSLAAGLALPLLAGPLGWRAIFAMASALMVGSAYAVRRQLDGSMPVRRARADRGRRRERPGPSLRPVRVAALANTLGNAAAFGLSSFLVVYAVDNGISVGTAGALLAAVSLLSAATRVLLGHRADRRGEGDRMNAVIALLAAATVGYLVLILGTPGAIVAGAIVGGLGWGWGGLVMLAVVEYQREAPAEAISLTMTGIFLGACIGPLIAGVLAAQFSYTATWIACAAMAVAAAGLYASVRNELRVGARPRSPGLPASGD